MENIKLRCHFSIIFESVWQFWVVIAVMLFNMIEVLQDAVHKIEEIGLAAFMKSGGFWAIAAFFALTLAIFGFQFFRWRKTWISIEENLVIIERRTLRKYKNTIAMENITAVNLEKNIFERMVGTCRIKMDTGSMTTAYKTDVSIVLKEETALAFKKTVLERIRLAKGLKETEGEEQEKEQAEADSHKSQTPKGEIFCCNTKDMLKHSLYTLPIFSVLVVIAGIAGAAWYISSYGFDSFFREALGGFIAVVLMVLGNAYNILKRFLKYYGFTVYRQGRELHVKCGLLKLISYTIPIDKITALQIEQPLMSRICRKYSVKVITVGVGDEEGEASNITMSLSADELEAQLRALVPEYVWGGLIEINKEEKAGIRVRAVKSIKWHIMSVAAALIMIFATDWSWWIAIGAPAAFDLFVSALYILSHLSSGYMIREEGLTLCGGYFTKRYSLFKYDRMQVMQMVYHPAAKKTSCGDGMISFLNLTVGVPYIKEKLASEISDKMIGGRK